MSDNQKHCFISLRIKNLRVGDFEFKNFRFETESEEEAEALQALIKTLPGPMRVNVNYLGLQAEAVMKKAELNRDINAGKSAGAVGAIPAPGLQAKESLGPTIHRGPMQSAPVSPAAAVTGTQVKIPEGSVKAAVEGVKIDLSALKK